MEHRANIDVDEGHVDINGKRYDLVEVKQEGGFRLEAYIGGRMVAKASAPRRTVVYSSVIKQLDELGGSNGQ